MANSDLEELSRRRPTRTSATGERQTGADHATGRPTNGPAPQEWTLAADPRLVWIPLHDGRACGVLAHHWDLDGPDITFYASIRADHGHARLAIASFPQALLGDDETLRAALLARELDWDDPFGNFSAALVCEPGTKILATTGPALRAWPTVAGPDFRVLHEDCHLEGPHACFTLPVQGWPPDSAPVAVDALRLPANLLPPEVRDSITRQW